MLANLDSRTLDHDIHDSNFKCVLCMLRILRDGTGYLCWFNCSQEHLPKFRASAPERSFWAQRDEAPASCGGHRGTLGISGVLSNPLGLGSAQYSRQIPHSGLSSACSEGNCPRCDLLQWIETCTAEEYNMLSLSVQLMLYPVPRHVTLLLSVCSSSMACSEKSVIVAVWEITNSGESRNHDTGNPRIRSCSTLVLYLLCSYQHGGCKVHTV